MNEYSPIKLRIPRQDLADFSRFPLTAEGAAEWARSLPMADTRLAVTRLREAVRELNRVELPPTPRLAIMGALFPVLETAVTRLSRRFLNQPLVLPEEPRQMAELAENLYSTFGTAYTLVAAHAIQWHGEPEHAGGAARLACEGLQRAILCAGRRMLQTCQLYQHVEPRDWLTLHQLYALGERQQLEQLPVRDPQGRRVTLRHSYLQTLLLGCCKTNQLRQSDMTGIYQGLREWCAMVTLRGTDDPEQGLFAVDLGSDRPPMYNTDSTPQSPQLRYIDTRELVSYLIAARDRDRGKGRPGLALEDDTTLPTNLLDHLAASLGSHSLRNFSRKQGIDTVLEVAMGLNSTHYHAAGGRTFSDLLPDHLTDSVPSEGSLFASTDERSPEQRFPIVRTKAINSSPGGYCLEWSEGTPVNLRSGDVMCVREPGQESWVVAAVRWISALPKAPTLVGVELLSPRAMPYAARAVDQRGKLSEPMRVLLLPEIKLVGKPHTLLTPRTGFRERQKAVLLHNGEEFLIQLQRQVGATAGYSQFDFRYIRELEQSSSAAAEEVELPRSAFDSVWSKI